MDVWATFPRQNEAIHFANKQADLRVFSFQDHFSGKWRFLTSTYKEFWKRYNIMDPNSRHHYEVILEGVPCNLYFDLEFNKSENSSANADLMVDALISFTMDALLRKYSIKGSNDWVIELDSSTTEKFSRHLIIRIPKTYFKDNSHVGAFVSEILNVREHCECPDIGFLVDRAVYSKNRCFRLVLSTKQGKKSFLLPTNRFKCKEMCDEDMFMSCLICNVERDCDRFLICKMELKLMRAPRFQSKASTTYVIQKSSFPSLDAFVESICSFGDSAGKIQRWNWFEDNKIMVYNMSKSRYCHRIGREHKSNHVFYVFDLKWGFYYQKCHDPDCKGYKSPAHPIPIDVINGHVLSNP